MTDQTTLKKAAYATLGLPSQIAQKLRDGMANLAESSSETRERLMSQLEDSIDEWKAEGEKMTSKVIDQVRDRSESVRETTMAQAAKARDITRGVTQAITEPVVPISQIDGVGPNYEQALIEAGVVSPLGLLERCDSENAIQRLSEQTGIPTGHIERWVDDAKLSRINGIGEESMVFLNQVGVGSIKYLAEQSPAELRARTAEIDDKDLGPIPSEATLARWIQTAKKL